MPRKPSVIMSVQERKDAKKQLKDQLASAKEYLKARKADHKEATKALAAAEKEVLALETRIKGLNPAPATAVAA